MTQTRRTIKCDGKEYVVVMEGSTQTIEGLKGELSGKFGAGEIRSFIRGQVRAAKPKRARKAKTTAQATPCGETPQTYDESPAPSPSTVREPNTSNGHPMGTVVNIQKNGPGTPWLVTLKIDGMRSEQPFNFGDVVEARRTE